MHPIKLLLISAHRQLANNFAVISKSFFYDLDIMTIITNYLSDFDPNLTLAIEIDLILLPVGLSGLDGLEIIRSIRRMNEKIPILVSCSCYAKAEFDILPNYTVQGVTTTSDSAEELATAIYDVYNNEPNIFERQYNHSKQLILQLTQNTEDNLTSRESNILQMIANGLKDKKIAEELNISESSVRNSLTKIFNKFDCHDRTLAILIAISKGLIYQPPYPKKI